MGVPFTRGSPKTAAPNRGQSLDPWWSENAGMRKHSGSPNGIVEAVLPAALK